MALKMTWEFRDDLPPTSAYAELFETTGWNKVYHASPQELQAALRRSWAVVSVYESGHLAGCGRIVSDGVLYAMIYDLIVLPSCQGQGIGSAILDRLIDKCSSAGIREVQLFSAAGKADFYRKRGFVERPTGAPGMRLATFEK